MALLLNVSTGSARRRRERRLRSFLRHERMTVRMELAAALHHSSFRGAGPETYDAPRSQRTANSRVDSVLFDLFAEDTEGARPDRIATLSGPHARVQRRTVQQIVDEVSPVPLLDDPVPQMVEQLPDVLQFFDRFAVPEQVIAVPKIFIESVPTRAFPRVTQLAEQLVEVPTIISFSLGSLLQSLLEYKQRTVEQNVDIPAVGGSGTGGGLSGFLPGQNYSMTAEQIVDNPVPRPGGAGDLQGFPRGQGSTALSEQIPEFPDPGGGREDFQPVQGFAASSSDSPGQAGQGVFRTFPHRKKSAKIPRTQGSELGAHSSSWTP